MKTGALFAWFFLAVGCSPSARNPGGPPACSLGGIGCFCVDTACTCTGSSACVTQCRDHCAVACTGTNSCTSACGTDCTATCTGSSVCGFDVGMGSTIGCTGTGRCEADCEGGGCDLTCDDPAGCMLACVNADDCTMVCASGAVRDCGGGVQVCNTDCPAAI